MSDHREIEQILRDVRFDVPQEIDEEILNDGLRMYERAFDTSKTRDPKSRVSREVRTAVAAVLLAAAGILTLTVFLDDPSSITLAGVEAAVVRQDWVHLKYDNGRELWICLLNGNRFYKREEGRYVKHFDYIRGLHRTYYADRKKIYDSPLESWEKPTSVWDAAGLDDYESEVGRRDLNREVEKYVETVEGQRLVRFDTYVTDVEGHRILLRRIWADPETRLPVRIRERLQRSERERQNREWITGTYDFPASGPTSIYDLGVPEDTVIVERERTPLAPEVQEIIDAAKQARKQFPENYRVLTWPAEKRGTGTMLGCLVGAQLVYRHGDRIRRNSYNVNVDLPLPASAETVFQWTQTQEPVNHYLLAEGVRYLRWRENPSAVTVEVRRDMPHIELDGCPTKYQWPYIFESNLQILTDVDDLPRGCVALRLSRGEQRHDYYVDPDHDYICVQHTEWRKADGRWEKSESHYEGRFLSDFARLPSGQWYATKRHKIEYSGLDNNIARKRCPYLIDVKLLNENDYPPDVFDTRKILEGAAVRDY